jgi:putative hemolysin
MTTKQAEMTKYIDLRKILKEQYPGLYKKLPNFIIYLLELIICQKKLNVYINKYIDYQGVAFTDKMIEDLNLSIDIDGKENLPENGRCFFAANHHFGVLDGMILANIIGHKYGRFMGISNEAFNLIPQLKSTVTSVNAYGRSAKAQILELEKIYSSDLPINHFPAGKVARRHKGKIQDKIWHKSFIGKAISEKRDVVPIFFHGRNSMLFYNMHSIRVFLGIKMNIELMLLPSEMIKKQDKHIKVTIGKCIPYSEFDNGVPHQVIADQLKEYVYNLPENINKPFKVNKI